jgi:tetratricopeptide (TPR) repeat protein
MPDESVSERATWEFGTLLKWHFDRGTRPNGECEVWTPALFAHAVEKSEGALRNWFKGVNFPTNIGRILMKLFGEDARNDSDLYKEWRKELEDAFEKSRGKHGADVETKPAQGALEKRIPDNTGGVSPQIAFMATNFKVYVPAHFQGREGELQKISAALVPRDGRPARVILYGMPGVGKTVIAHAYVALHETEYHAIWQIDARTPSTMRANLVGMGVRLGWVAPDQQEEAAFQMVMDKLSHDGEGLLLIYENASDAKAVEPLLPSIGKAHVIILANDYAWRRLGEAFEVENWDETIGGRFLIARSGDRATGDDQAAKLSLMLGGLPLAHEQAAAYCEEKEQISLADYIKLFNEGPIELLADSEFAPAEYGRTVARTFHLAILAAKERHCAAEWVIAFASMLSPEPVPVFLLSEALRSAPGQFAAELTGDGLEKALRAARAFALIDRVQIKDQTDQLFATDCIQLRRLIHQIAAARVSDEDRRTITHALVRVAARLYPKEISMDIKSWPSLHLLEPHVSHLTRQLKNLDKANVDTEAVILVNGLATYFLYVRHSYEEAHAHFENCLLLAKFAHVSPSLNATIANNYGVLLVEEGEFELAADHLNEALKCRELEFGESDGEVAIVLNNIGLSYYRQKKFGEAVLAFHRALSIYQRLPGEFNAEKASCLYNAAHLFLDIGEFNRAIELFKTALNMGVMTYGFRNVHTATTLKSLAVLLERQDRISEARIFYVVAFSIYKGLYGSQERACLELGAKLAALDNERTTEL